MYSVFVTTLFTFDLASLSIFCNRKCYFVLERFVC